MKINKPKIDREIVKGTMFIDKMEYTFTARRVKQNEYVSIAKAAEIIGINKLKIYRYIDLGIIPEDCIYKQKGLRTMINLKKVEKIIERLKAEEKISN